MTELTGRQRKRLRGLAHGLRPVVQVGARGLSSTVRAQIDGALARHELVKVRIEAERSERAAILEAIQQSTGAAAAGIVGKVAVLYRPHPDPRRSRRLLADPSQSPE